MRANPLFLESISKVKKLVFLRVLHRIVLITLLLFLGMYTLAICGEKAGIFYGDISFYVMAFALSVGGALGYAYLKRENFTNVLIGIDTRLKLQDRSSTAYEYHTFGKPSEFANLLIEDAGRRLSRLSSNQLFPPKFSRVYLWLSLLIVINLALVFVDQIPLVSKQPQVDREQARKISTLLKTYPVQKSEGINDKEQEKTQQRVHEKLDNLAQKLDQQTITRTELVKSLHKTLKEVQGEQTRLAKELDSKLAEMENMEGINIQNALQVKQFSANDLQKLKEMLNTMSNNEIPDSLERNLALLDEQRRLGDLLEKVIDDVEPETNETNNANPSDADKNTTTAPNTNDSESGENTPENTGESRASSRPNNNNRGGKSLDQPGSDQAQASDDNQATDQGMPREGNEEDGSPAPGRGTSQASKLPPHKLDSATSSAIQDKTTTAPKDQYSVQIRSVTEIGQATLPEADVTRPYRQELESILQKEEIPLNYRDYIKNYFLSIGLTEPQSPEDTKKK